MRSRGRHPDGYAYSRFCEWYRAWEGRLEPRGIDSPDKPLADTAPVPGNPTSNLLARMPISDFDDLVDRRHLVDPISFHRGFEVQIGQCSGDCLVLSARQRARSGQDRGKQGRLDGTGQGIDPAPQDGTVKLSDTLGTAPSHRDY